MSDMAHSLTWGRDEAELVTELQAAATPRSNGWSLITTLPFITSSTEFFPMRPMPPM